jgi:hypothetical protein
VKELLSGAPHTAVESQHGTNAEPASVPTGLSGTMPHLAPVAAQHVPFWHVPNPHRNGPEQSVLMHVAVLGVWMT